MTWQPTGIQWAANSSDQQKCQRESPSRTPIGVRGNHKTTQFSMRIGTSLQCEQTNKCVVSGLVKCSDLAEFTRQVSFHLVSLLSLKLYSGNLSCLIYSFYLRTAISSSSCIFIISFSSSLDTVWRFWWTAQLSWEKIKFQVRFNPVSFPISPFLLSNWTISCTFTWISVCGYCLWTVKMVCFNVA